MAKEELKQEADEQQTVDVTDEIADEVVDDQTVEDTAAQEDEAADSETVISRLKADLEAKNNEVQEYDNRLKRLQADFDNFRRRTGKEKEELSAVILQNIIHDLLPTLDNFERALAADANDGEAFKNGMQMVAKHFMEILSKNGLEPINAVGEKFDPNFHQAVMRVEDDSMEEDTVAEELQRGYSVHGRVIRPSMVKVVS